MKADKMIRLLERLVPNEGVITDIIDKVNLFRIVKSSPRRPQCYEPGIIILAQGQKRIFLDNEIITYNPLNYLVLSVPLPFECETTASADKPLLGLHINVDAATVGEILLHIDDNQPKMKSIPKGIYSEALDDKLIDAVIRLLETLSSSNDRRFLGPIIVKEIIYRVLCGKKGDALRALAYKDKKFFQIARVLNTIHESYSEKLDLNTLALEAGMSISAFHSSFKAVTKSSPLQYIKNIRLHKAKLLMTSKGVNAYNASFDVGYESPSQFNREYKRLFGLPPGKDTVLGKAAESRQH